MRIIIALLLMALVLVAASCGTEGSSVPRSKKLVAVKELFYSYGWNSYEGMTSKYVDTLYGVGDTVILLSTHYVICRD